MGKNDETQEIKVVPLSKKPQNEIPKAGNPNPEMKKQAKLAPEPDTIAMPTPIQILADKVSELMRDNHVTKIEVVASRTYINVDNDRVYIFDQNGTVRIKSEFSLGG